MSKFLVFDTETTGLPPRAPRGEPPISATDPRQPRLCSFAGIVCDEDGAEVSRKKFYIKPSGWSVAAFTARQEAAGQKTAVSVNGLTDEILNENGVPILSVLDEYSGAIRSGLIPCAFNAVFDMKIMRGGTAQG